MFLAVAALVSSSSVLAMSFGRAPSSVLLGSPLNYTVPVRLEGGESVTPECVSAEVQVGDRRLLPGDVRVAIEPGTGPDDRLLRITSSVAMDEPVVAVTVTVGCGARSTRRFTAFADPPGMGITPPVASAIGGDTGAQPATAATSDAPASAAVPGAMPPRAEPQARNLPLRRPPAVSSERRLRERLAGGSRPVPKVVREAAERPRKVDPAVAEAAPPPARRRPDADAAALKPMPLGNARLRLEAADPESFPPPSASAASRPPLAPIFSDSPLAVELAASEAARMRALESSVEQLRAESKANRELVQQMRSRLSESEFSSRLVPWLGAALALVAALALWLGLRLRRAKSKEEGQWWVSAAAPLDSAQPDGAEPAAQAAKPAEVPAAKSPAKPSGPTKVMPTPKPAAKPVAAAPAMPEVVARLTETDSASGAALQVVDAEASIPGRSARDVAIDELIDLEQQADFFVVLGQDDAAIDLLLGHIRSSGGQSPMPYMKLLEIYRRKGDREAYDRLREKFNTRFNAIAPEWDADLRAGRTIDEYPEEFQRLSAAWPRPLDSLAELEALLFRRESGQAFELPAYRDLLFLYSLARDHLEDATGATSAVDLLLPLGEAAGGDAGGEVGATLTGPDWDNARSVEITSSSEFSTLDLDLATQPAPIDGGAQVVVTDAADAPAARLLDVDLELKLDDPAPPTGEPSPSRR